LSNGQSFIKSQPIKKSRHNARHFLIATPTKNHPHPAYSHPFQFTLERFEMSKFGALVCESIFSTFTPIPARGSDLRFGVKNAVGVRRTLSHRNQKSETALEISS